jgi:carboxyl-terminal processing protease
MEEYRQSGLNKMIIDLRGNPGGFLQVSVDVASWFLPAGKVIVEEDYNGNRKNILHRSKGHGNWGTRDKLVILIDEGSASASEIVAGALKEHGVATLVGSNTFGKGSVQELITVSPDTKLKITIAEWLTPQGNSFSNGGLSPDIEVERTSEDIIGGEDPQMEKAIELLS